MARSWWLNAPPRGTSPKGHSGAAPGKGRASTPSPDPRNSKVVDLTSALREKVCAAARPGRLDALTDRKGKGVAQKVQWKAVA